MRLVGQYSQRCIVTHGSGRLCSVHTHRSQRTLYIFTCKAKGTQPPRIIGNGIRNLTTTTQRIQLNPVGRKPLTIRFGCRQLIFQFAIVIDTSFLGIDQQDFTRLKTTFFLDSFRLEIDDTRLTGYHHHIVFRNQVAGRTQTVTVQHTSGITSIAEQQGCRAIPRFHQNRVVFIKCLQVFTDRVLVVERFRYQHGHGMRQAQSGHDEEFQYIIKRRTVTHSRLDNWANLFHITQQRSGKHTFTRFHPPAVSTDGIDFTIVCQQTERLCQTPSRECICTKTRMYNSQSTGKIGLSEVLKIFTYLHRRQHTFIYNVLARQRNDVKVFVMHTAFNLFAHYI